MRGGRLPDLPPPPRDVFTLIEEGRPKGLWLRWARDERVRQDYGGRYRVSREGCLDPLYVDDDLGAVRDWIQSY